MGVYRCMCTVQLHCVGTNVRRLTESSSSIRVYTCTCTCMCQTSYTAYSLLIRAVHGSLACLALPRQCVLMQRLINYCIRVYTLYVRIIIMNSHKTIKEVQRHPCHCYLHPQQWGSNAAHPQSLHTKHHLAFDGGFLSSSEWLCTCVCRLLAFMSCMSCN